MDAADCAVGYGVGAGQAFDAVASSRRALHTLGDLASLFRSRSRRDAGAEGGWTEYRVDRESLADAVAELEAEGRVEVWEHPEKGPLVVLSALSAEALGLELDGTGLRWRDAKATQRRLRLKRRKEARGRVESGKTQEVEPEPPPPPLETKGGDKAVPGVTHFTKGQLALYLVRLDVGGRLLGPATPKCEWCPPNSGCRAWGGYAKGFVGRK